MMKIMTSVILSAETRPISRPLVLPKSALIVAALVQKLKISILHWKTKAKKKD